jgi:monovalent cation:proton antiporter-2 (CPA2) family protein
MADTHTVSFLPPIVAFCASAVIAVPLAQRLGVGGVLGYMIAGVALGPAGFGVVSDAESIRHVAEMGVVLLLFIIGLELEVSRLFAMRRDIFGLGFAQMAASGIVVGLIARWAGLSTGGAAAAGAAFALSATAIALQILEERGDLQTPYGQRAFAVLLFQDLSIVPILTLLPLFAPERPASGGFAQALSQTGLAAAAIATLVVAGRYLLNPLFRIVARFGGREVMTAAALLVVLGSALLMESVGLSMALGAFLAGLLLAESHFKHQLEADIDPFRGLLLGLFFMSVGMGLDLKTLARFALPLLATTLALIAAKLMIAAFLLRLSGSSKLDGWRSAALLTPAGEFSFVLIPMALGLAMLTPTQASFLTAAAALTMLFGPLAAKAVDWIADRREAARAALASDLPAENFDGANGSVLVIGFGRFGQLVNQIMLTEAVDVTVIDKATETIKVAANFGFKVYYGDGANLSVLHAAGAAHARLVAICVDDRQTALTIAALVRQHFPLAKIYTRAYDRRHAIELLNAGVDFQMRETLLSALWFGAAVLRELGVTPERARAVVEDVRRRDDERLVIQQAEGIQGGAALLKPQPLQQPKQTDRALSQETRAIIEQKEDA